MYMDACVLYCLYGCASLMHTKHSELNLILLIDRISNFQLFEFRIAILYVQTYIHYFFFQCDVNRASCSEIKGVYSFVCMIHFFLNSEQNQWSTFVFFFSLGAATQNSSP